MPQLTASLSLVFGESLPAGQNVPTRITLPFTLTYTEETIKTIHVPAGLVDHVIELDSASTPKFFLARALDVDVDIKLAVDGIAPFLSSALAFAQGWVMIANPNGQVVNSILVTAPASPTTGARVQVLAFE